MFLSLLSILSQISRLSHLLVIYRAYTEQQSFLVTDFSYIELQVQINRIHPLQVPNGQVYNYSPELTLLQCHTQQPDTGHPTVHHQALYTLMVAETPSF